MQTLVTQSKQNTKVLLSLHHSLIVTHIPTSDQVVDTVTKPLSYAQFFFLCYKLNIINYFQ